MLRVNLNHLNGGLDLSAYRSKIAALERSLRQKSAPGSEWTGWLDYPERISRKEVERIVRYAEEVRSNYDVLVVCGIGGSYLGARAAIEAIRGLRNRKRPEILYLGQTLSSDYIAGTLDYLRDKRFAVNVISKSGSTTETAISFRLLKELLETTLGPKKAAEAIFATTDPKKGILRRMAEELGWVTFDLPSDIGGRYSVFTPVGLFPLACAGVDIKAFLRGAARAVREYAEPNVMRNPAFQYAAARHYQYTRGYSVELLVSYEPRLVQLAEWWKQLFGESEGKEHKGLFPAAATFTTDLHSLGQFIQDGTQLLFETIIHIENPHATIAVPADEKDLDKLNYLAGKTLAFVEDKAFVGTLQAHSESGHVPNVIIELEKLDAESLGHLLYFFMKACAISGLLLGVNPFDQPGVEVYKKNMFRLLGKKE